MGAGDFKLLAALGAWLGAWALPVLVLGASVGAVLVAVVMRLMGRGASDQRMPFGPYLVLAALLVLWLKTQGFEVSKALLV